MKEIKTDLSLFLKLAEELLSLEQSEPVSARVDPERLEQYDVLKLNDNGIPESELTEALRLLIRDTPKTSGTRFFNQLYGGRVSKSVLGELLSVLLNTSMYTYKVAGVQVGIEKEVIRKSLDLIEFPENADGAFAPGGSLSNFMALVIARDRALNQGVPITKLTAYTSETSHYSVPKNIRFAGLKNTNLRKIAVDESGSMLPGALEEAIAGDVNNGLYPFFINATAGTTVTGVFDPIEPIAQVAKKYSLFLHVDGAYSGAVIFSEKYRSLIRGVHHADSFSYNAHKMPGTPITCSLLLVKNGQELIESFGSEADYLFQTDTDELNPGKKSMQCGRRNDALKLWTLWKSVGTRGMGELVEQRFEMADYARRVLNANTDFKVFDFGTSASVCFNYKDYDPVKLCEALYRSGRLMVSHGRVGEENGIRLVTVNAGITTNDIDDFFSILIDFAEAHPSMRRVSGSVCVE